MGWPGWIPPAGGSFIINWYDRIRTYWEAIRERMVAAGRDSAWPDGSFAWATGVIDDTKDESTGAAAGRLRFYDTTVADDMDEVGWVDDADIKRWTTFGGTFDGDEIDPTPGSFKLVLIPPDTGDPPATELADPKDGFVLPIVDNGDDWVEVADDGELFLNGLAIDDYIGFRYKIIRNGIGSRQGYGYPQRYPLRPNDQEIHYGLMTDADVDYITDDREPAADRWQIPRDFEDDIGREVIFQDGDGYWWRLSITGAEVTSGTIKNKLTFGAIDGTAPDPGGQFWIVEPEKFWRPRCALGLERRTGRRGPFWKTTNPGGGYWYARWNATLSQTYASHQAYDDTIAAAPIAIDSIHLDDGSPGGLDITVFDFDGRTEHDVDNGQDDHLFNPRIYWSYRGLQVGVEDAFTAANWLDPTKDYEGDPAIPKWERPTWVEYFHDLNTRTVEIESLQSPDPTYHTSATVNFADDILLPDATDEQGAYTSLPCTWAIIEANGEVSYGGTGTVTEHQLTRTEGNFFDNPPPPDSDGNTQVGLTIILAFCAETGTPHENPDVASWTRKYPRMVQRIYSRTCWIPENEDAEPTEDAPGTWIKREASTNYAEYAKHGKLLELGHAFIDDEIAIYVGDNFEDPTTNITDAGNALVPFYDAYYQGTPNNPSVSSWPRWEGNARRGVCTGVGPGQIEDTAQTWWRGTAPLVLHEGTADSGSSDTLIFDSTKSGNGFWDQPNRFVGMIMEVETDPDDAPDVFERRPIVAYDYLEQKCVVDPSFDVATDGLRYRIREPAAGGTGGAIMNLWEDRKLTITKADGSGSDWTFIKYSDDDHLYFDAGDLAVTPEEGDVYLIEQHEPGRAFRYDPGDEDATISGWAGPLAVGTKPTIVTAFGRYRKRDYIGLHYWTELYEALDSLRWIRRDHAWSSRSPSNYEDNIEEDNDQICGTSFLGGPDFDSAESLISRMPGALGSSGPVGANPPLEDGFVAGVQEQDGDAPACNWTNAVGGPFKLERLYAYAVLSATTDQLMSSFSLYVAADSQIEEVANGHGTPLVDQDVKTFDDCGTDLEFGLFHNWVNLSADTLFTRRTSTAFGNAATPPVIDNVVYSPPVGGESGTPQPPYNTFETGYTVTRWWAIEKFDVDGGLTYLT